MKTLQYQLSNGNWTDIYNAVDDPEDRTDEFLELCVQYNEGIDSHKAALAAMDAGRELRYHAEKWYCQCRLFDTAAHNKRIESSQRAQYERDTSQIRCRSCDQQGRAGNYPFSTLPGSGLCDDCV